MSENETREEGKYGMSLIINESKTLEVRYFGHRECVQSGVFIPKYEGVKTRRGGIFVLFWLFFRV